MWWHTTFCVVIYLPHEPGFGGRSFSDSPSGFTHTLHTIPGFVLAFHSPWRFCACFMGWGFGHRFGNHRCRIQSQALGFTVQSLHLPVLTLTKHVLLIVAPTEFTGSPKSPVLCARIRRCQMHTVCPPGGHTTHPKASFSHSTTQPHTRRRGAGCSTVSAGSLTTQSMGFTTMCQVF